MPFCDLNCRHARWPDASGADGSGSCRTFLALYCRKNRRLVHKNAPCPDKEPKEPGAGKRGQRSEIRGQQKRKTECNGRSIKTGGSRNRRRAEVGAMAVTKAEGAKTQK